MVLQRRLDYGFNGYQVPVVPRASRSARGKGSVRKKCEDIQTRTFDVLASVAGNFLLEGESSAPSDATSRIGQHDIATSSVKWDQEDGKQFCQEHCHNYEFNGILHHHESMRFKGGLASKRFDHLGKICVTKELEAISGKNRCGRPFSKLGGKHFGNQEEGVFKINTESQLLNGMGIDSGKPPIEGSLKDAMEIGCNPPAQVTSGSTLKMPSLRDFMALAPFSGNCADVKGVSRDNDENFGGFSQHCTMEKTHRPLLYSVDRRTRNQSHSRHWNVSPNLKVGGHFGAAGKKTHIHPSGRFCDDHERSQKIFPFKKRKFFDQIPDSMPDACHRNEEFNSSDKRLNGGHYHSDAQNATAAFCSAAGQKASSESRDCNVKFSIKSFKVPELFVEIPATATVGSLKRTVMEAVTAILGDGLHVGILVQGKKVRDDSKTLLQTGISQNSKHSTLGFMLEPKNAQMMAPACMKIPPFRSGNVHGRPIRRPSTLTLQQGTSSVSADPPKFGFESCFGSDLDAVPSLADASTDNAVLDSRALVVVPPISTEAFAVVPFHRKSSNPEFGQRRIRRPFSVPEVEALVQAVEKLGTGRWRDVKMCAFDNASHRTYVDLKDKWKTLVHTARISPQQRRGEQVPQELLDRVLAADAYWSRHQVRQQIRAAV